MALTARNLRFIELYIQYVVLGQVPDGKRASQAQAFIDAGYNSKYPDVDACKLLKKPNVKAEVERRKAEILEQEKVTTEKVLAELRNVALVNPLDFFTWDENGNVKFKSSSKLTRKQAAAIAGIKKTKNGLEFKFHDKTAALELIGRNLKMFTDKMMVGGDPSNPSAITVSFIQPKE